MDPHPQHLAADCLIHLFTFLPEEDLLRASGVCQDWRGAADTPWLWRRLCLQRWTFCDLTSFRSERVDHSWKKYYLRRSHLEMKMTKGRTGGYTCRSLRGHTGKVVGVTYLQESSAQLPHLWNVSSTVCSAGTDGSVRTWNTQSGELLWCSPEQKPLSGIVSDERREVVITIESTGLIKTWSGRSGQELGSFSAPGGPFTLLQYDVNERWFLAVGNALGSLWTLAGAGLTKASSLVVGDSAIDILLVSPDKSLMVVGSGDGGAATVICTQSLTSPSEDGDPLRVSTPIRGSGAAAFIPTQPARLAVIDSEPTQKKTLYVFDLSIKRSKFKSEIQVQQVESFPVSLEVSPHRMILKASDSNRLVLVVDQELLVFSLKGDLLARFKDHTLRITSVHVLPCRDGIRGPLLTRDDVEQRRRPWDDPGEPVPPTRRFSHHVQSGDSRLL
ncbi:F-box/WD repeat-containing protein 12 isoform X2 [Antennarius striatus]|uniref:F-box/WD repeat-containing protein 12 isoform X2 n=1 Tax=Antennarius striatus TaxID=241820 RepID=UPI0035B35E36